MIREELSYIQAVQFLEYESEYHERSAIQRYSHLGYIWRNGR